MTAAQLQPPPEPCCCSELGFNQQLQGYPHPKPLSYWSPPANASVRRQLPGGPRLLLSLLGNLSSSLGQEEMVLQFHAAPQRAHVGRDLQQPQQPISSLNESLGLPRVE